MILPPRAMMRYSRQIRRNWTSISATRSTVSMSVKTTVAVAPIASTRRIHGQSVSIVAGRSSVLT